MIDRPARLSGGTKRAIARQAGDLATAATQRIEAEYAWYSTLSAADRSWVGVVAQAGIADFIRWLESGDVHHRPDAAEVFAAAPRELTRSISLGQTLDLIRAVVDEVEGRVDSLAGRRDLAALRENVLRYSREMAFEAARIYARAAEEHGAWESRLEALVVDAVLRGEADEAMRSRATALGWGQVTHVVVVAGEVPEGAERESDPSAILDRLRRAAKRAGHPLLSAVQGRRLICILGRVEDPTAAARAIADHFGTGPVVIGPTVPHLFAAGRSARAALSGLRAAPAWPGVPRPCLANDLLAERALLGDGPARSLLEDRIWTPLSRHDSLLDTASAYLESKGGLEATARALFVHANTVRYRLGRIAEETGYDLTEPHEAFTVRLAIALGRLRRS